MVCWQHSSQWSPGYFLYCKGPLLAPVQLVHQNHQFFSAKLHFNQLTPRYRACSWDRWMGLFLPVSEQRMDGIGFSVYENESQEDYGNKHLNIQNIKFRRLFLCYLIMKYVFRRAEYSSGWQIHLLFVCNFSAAFFCFETPIYYILYSIKWN